MPVLLKDDHLSDPLSQHMRRATTALRRDQSVGDALATLRGTVLAEAIVYFYVVDENDKLVGVVPTRRLLMSDPTRPVASIMVDRVVALRQSATVLEACEYFERYGFMAFPVVDGDGRLAGVIDLGLFADDLVDLAEKQARDDVYQLIGIHVAESRQASAWARARDRLPWLLCNVAAGLICAWVVGLYGPFLDSAIVLAFFMPMVLALSESISMQSTTLALQALHRPQGKAGRVGRALVRESASALVVGVVLGGLVGVSSRLWTGRGDVAATLGVTIASAMLTASLLGAILPRMVHWLRLDPKVAAGPLVLAMADVATLLFYFRIGGWLLEPSAGATNAA